MQNPESGTSLPANIVPIDVCYAPVYNEAHNIIIQPSTSISCYCDVTAFSSSTEHQLPALNLAPYYDLENTVKAICYLRADKRMYEKRLESHYLAWMKEPLSYYDELIHIHGNNLSLREELAKFMNSSWLEGVSTIVHLVDKILLFSHGLIKKIIPDELGVDFFFAISDGLCYHLNIAITTIKQSNSNDVYTNQPKSLVQQMIFVHNQYYKWSYLASFLKAVCPANESAGIEGHVFLLLDCFLKLGKLLTDIWVSHLGFSTVNFDMQRKLVFDTSLFCHLNRAKSTEELFSICRHSMCECYKKYGIEFRLKICGHLDCTGCLANLPSM